MIWNAPYLFGNYAHDQIHLRYRIERIRIVAVNFVAGKKATILIVKNSIITF